MSSLDTTSIGDFLARLNQENLLGLSPEQLDHSGQVLTDQWFNYASELAEVDEEAFAFLDLPRHLSDAIYSYFHISELDQREHNLQGLTLTSVPAFKISGFEIPQVASPIAAAKHHIQKSSPSQYGKHIEDGAMVDKKSLMMYGDDVEIPEVDRIAEGPEDAQDGDGAAPEAFSEQERKRSLDGLGKAVTHICQDNAADEQLMDALGKILRGGIAQNSNKITQSVLRKHLKQIEKSTIHSVGTKTDEIKREEKKESSDESSSDDSIHSDFETHVKDTKDSKAEPTTIIVHDPSSRSGQVPSASSCHSCYQKVSDETFEKLKTKCKHRVCKKCLHDYTIDLVDQKQAVGMTCMVADCQEEIPIGALQQVLDADEFESYLQATLLAFIEQDSLTFICPKADCKAAISVQPNQDFEVPDIITERGDDGKVLSREAFIHYQEYRVRCRDCQAVFCANCKTLPYHKGFTCTSYREYESARQCRFCGERLDEKNTAPNSPAPSLRDVCSDEDCIQKRDVCCTKYLECGCPCNGVRDEKECLPCLKCKEDVAEEYCTICYVDFLMEGPCVKLPAPCKHIFHYLCLKKRIESLWNGARITFNFLDCPMCSHQIDHPGLKDVMKPMLELKQDIEAKSLQRLEFEGRLREPAIVNPDGEYYNDPVRFAMKSFLFYQCFKCKKAYFAGGYQCQEAGDNFEAADLVCPSCQPSTNVLDCPRHGRDWLAFKCRYCCNYANWTCWSRTRFCDRCHKAGTWQKLVHFRSGKNKKKLWEYPQCAGLIAPIERIVRNTSLSDDAKTKAVEKLWSVAAQCPLGIRHPPNGLEFGLGCSMCNDDKKNGNGAGAAGSRLDSKQAARLSLQEIRINLAKSHPQGKEFKYQHDFDGNGVIHWLGTCANTGPWSNPAEAGFVRVQSSALMSDSMPVSATVGRDCVRCVTKPERNSWFMFMIPGFSLMPTHYSLRHYSSWDTECLRHWVFEGSNDGLTWDTLMVHTNDIGLVKKKGATHTWRLDMSYNPLKKKYRMFRIIQTGRNSNSNYYLAISGFELYGTLSNLDDVKQKPSHQEYKIRDFVPRYDFDENGICYYLGTHGGRTPWANPADLRMVRVTSSPLCQAPPGAPLSAFVGRDLVRLVTVPKPGMWMAVDFMHRRILPSHYTLRHYSSWDLEALRNWAFEASNDGQTWTILKAHIDDQALDEKGATHTWSIDAQPESFCIFRIRQTDKNSNNHYYLANSGFEIYGRLFEPEEDDGDAKSGAVANGKLSSLDAKSPKQFTYSYDFDEGGLFYYLGTHGHSRPWANPADLGLVSVTSSPLAVSPPSRPASTIVGREVVRCCTIPKPYMWFAVDLVNKYFIPTHYTLRHYISWDTEALRSWRLEGSNSKNQWTALRSHYDDKSLNRKGASATWSIHGCKQAYRHFRIVQIGLNSNNNHYFALSGFELYGTLVYSPDAKASRGDERIPLLQRPPMPPLDRLPNYQDANLEHKAASKKKRKKPPKPRTPPSSINFSSSLDLKNTYGREFTHESDFDENGILYYLGTQCGTQPWQNPGSLGYVQVDSSPLAQVPPSEPAWSLTGRSLIRCVTIPGKNAFFSFDFGNDCYIRPSAYSLKHYSSWDTEAIREWKLLASNDGVKWKTLKTHKKDCALDGKGSTHTWDLTQEIASHSHPNRAYRMFRILQTGKNSNRHWYLALSGFEIYGTVYATPDGHGA